MFGKKISGLTPKQKAYLKENFGKMDDHQLYQELAQLGPEADQNTFRNAVQEISSEKEKKVFSHRISVEELEYMAGGSAGEGSPECRDSAKAEARNCSENLVRSIYGSPVISRAFPFSNLSSL